MSFLFDEQISPRISEALKVMGEPVLHVAEVRELGRGTPDAVILPYCGSNELVLVTLDRRMLESPHLHALIHEYAVGAFFVVGQSRKVTPSPWLILKTVVRAWENMKRVAETEARPFMKEVRPGGSIKNTGWKPRRR